MKSTNTVNQFRATLEDTKKKQKLFRQELRTLIKENKPVPVEDKDKLLNLLADSNFGLGTVACTFWLNNHKTIKIDNLEKFIRDLIEFWNEPTVTGNFFFFSLGKYGEYTVSISELWKNILSKCGGINAEAIAMSIRISKEREKREFEPGASLDNV